MLDPRLLDPRFMVPQSTGSVMEMQQFLAARAATEAQWDVHHQQVEPTLHPQSQQDSGAGGPRQAWALGGGGNQPNLDPLAYLGDNGCWIAGGEPEHIKHVPQFPSGNTEPPGPCKPGCRCGQVAAHQSELVKPWIIDKHRQALAQQALQNFENHVGVLR